MIAHVSGDVGATAGSMIDDALRAAADRDGRAVLAVPGGSSPISTFAWLAAHHDGADTLLTWVDERHLPLPAGDRWQDLPAESNLRLAWAHWLSQTDRPPSLLPLARPGTLADAVRAVSAELDARAPRLHVALLGMGPDGHIASLFPGHAALRATARCVGVTDSPKPPPERLTLTLPALAAADLVVLVVTGAQKGAVLARVQAGDPALPLCNLNPTGDLHVVLDHAAAGELR